MPAFLIGTVTITDPERFAAYSNAIKGLSATFGGKPIAGGPVSEVMEGDSAVGERVVVTCFPSADQARAYLSSPIYLAAKDLRAGAAIVQLRLLTT